MRQVKGSIRFGWPTTHERQTDVDGGTHGIDNEEKAAARAGSQEVVMQEEELQVAGSDDYRGLFAKQRRASAIWRGRWSRRSKPPRLRMPCAERLSS